jgi:hypothetical protein
LAWPKSAIPSQSSAPQITAKIRIANISSNRCRTPRAARGSSIDATCSRHPGSFLGLHVRVLATSPNPLDHNPLKTKSYSDFVAALGKSPETGTGNGAEGLTVRARSSNGPVVQAGAVATKDRRQAPAWLVPWHRPVGVCALLSGAMLK